MSSEVDSLLATGAFRVGSVDRFNFEREAALPFRSASCLKAGDLIEWPFHRTWDGSDVPQLNMAEVRGVRGGGEGVVQLWMTWIQGAMVIEPPSLSVGADTAFQLQR